MKVPRKPAHRFVFVSNIKDPLAEDLNPFPRLMEAFLLSETYSTPKTLSLAAKAKKSGSLMVSDNGNFSRMKKIASRFEKKGFAICAAALKEANKGAVSQKTLKQRQTLMSKIQEAVTAEQQSLDIAEIVKRQLKGNPDYLIGMEDFILPVMQLCNCLHPVFLPKPSAMKKFQKNTQKVYARQRDGVYGYADELSKKLKMLVYHAYDYQSAEQAASLNSAIKADGIAISFGAALASRNYIPSIKLSGKEYKFDSPLPESYLLSIALTLGATEKTRRKTPVHILGLGTPILIVLMGYLLQPSIAVSIDSTATYKDADDGNLYGSKNAFLKMDMYKVAAYALISNEPYNSSSPWFKWFNDQYPANWKGLKTRLKLKASDTMESVAVLLKKHPAYIEKYIPFFTPMRSGADPFIKKVRLARAGANFWVLKMICSEIRKRKNDPRKLHKWIEGEVKRYVAAASPKWALAVKAGYDIIKEQIK